MNSTTYRVADHLDGKDPLVAAIYRKLLAELEQFGPLIEEPKKTSIHLVHKTALAGVETRQNYLILNIKSAAPLGSVRAMRSEQVSAHRYHTRFKLTDPVEIDAELLGWLKQAYEISG